MSTEVPALGEEAVPPGEPEKIRIISQVCQELLATKPHANRQQHPWHHGCVRAVLAVHGDVPDELRHGIFASAGRFDALLRFSTGSEQDEREKDVHGIAIKLFGVPGRKIQPGAESATTQDFILLDNRVFFIRNAIDYADFALAMLAGMRAAGRVASKPLRKLIAVGVMYWKFFRRHREEFKIFMGMRKPPGDPLTRSYWSATPYRNGPNAVMYQLRPLQSPPDFGAAQESDANALRRRLAQRLEAEGASFELLVQRQIDPVAMPVEDPTVAWDELVSPPRRVATLHIPVQHFDTKRKRELSEGLTFNTWNSLPEHAPLGGINRARRIVYEELSRLRHRINGVEAAEPGATWLDDVWDAAPTSVSKQTAPPVHAGTS